MVKLDFICSRDECEHVIQDVLCTNGEPVGEHPVHCDRPMVIHWMTLPQGLSKGLSRMFWDLGGNPRKKFFCAPAGFTMTWRRNEKIWAAKIRP